MLAVVETVTPTSKRRDHVLKPDVHASIGIPCQWRVELDPTLAVHVLDGATYRLDQTITAGEPGRTRPFPIEVDPGAP